MKHLFVDTGAFLGVVSPGDRHEAGARSGWDEIEERGYSLYSSEHVLDEVVTLLARSQGGKFAAEWAGLHLRSGEMRWLQPTREDLALAVIFLQKFSDQKLSFTDAISFALMRRMKVDRVFGFDRHFATAGFRLWPEG